MALTCSLTLLRVIGVLLLSMPLIGAIVIHDTFDDGVIPGRYQAVGGATLAVFSGRLNVTMVDAGDGVEIDLSDTSLLVRCMQLEYLASGFTSGEGLIFETFVKDGSGGDILQYRAMLTQRNPEDVHLEGFDKGGKKIYERDFTIEGADVDGAFVYQLDIINCMWVFELKQGNINKNSSVVKAITDIENSAKLAKDMGLSRIVISSRSDGTFALETTLVIDEHVPEPASFGVTALGIAVSLIAARRRRR